MVTRLRVRPTFGAGAVDVIHTTRAIRPALHVASEVVLSYAHIAGTITDRATDLVYYQVSSNLKA